MVGVLQSTKQMSSVDLTVGSSLASSVTLRLIFERSSSWDSSDLKVSVKRRFRLFPVAAAVDAGRLFMGPRLSGNRLLISADLYLFIGDAPLGGVTFGRFPSKVGTASGFISATNSISESSDS